jgi:2-aminoadipate transaminase
MERMGPDVQSLAGGVPGVQAYPRGYEVHWRCSMGGPATPEATMNYADPRGHPELRHRIAAMAGAWGIDEAKRAVVVTSGGQQGLYLAVRSLLRPGDTVVVPAPTYPGMLHLLQQCSLRLAEAATDDQGLVVDDALAVLFARGARCLYVIPDFDNPTGATLTETRREALLALAAHHDAWIIEDLAYRDLRYEGEAVAPLSAASRGPASMKVVSVGSFSKSVMPSLRIGWVSAAPLLAEAMVQHLQAQQLTGSNPIQSALAAFLDDGYADHVMQVRVGYRHRRDAMIGAVARHLPRTRFMRPQGGFFLKLDLEPGMDEALLFEHALEVERVACIPGYGFFSPRRPGGFLRLCFSALDENGLTVGVQRLGQAYDYVRTNRPAPQRSRSAA